MPTHAHGQGYDLNFLIPWSAASSFRRPYFATGDFTAGAANINYVNALDKPMIRVSGGD